RQSGDAGCPEGHDHVDEGPACAILRRRTPDDDVHRAVCGAWIEHLGQEVAVGPREVPALIDRVRLGAGVDVGGDPLVPDGGATLTAGNRSLVIGSRWLALPRTNDQ